MVRSKVGEKAFLPLSYWRVVRQGVSLRGTLVGTDNRKHHAYTIHTICGNSRLCLHLFDVSLRSGLRFRHPDIDSPSEVVSKRGHDRFGLDFQFATEDRPEPYQPSHRTKQVMRTAVAARRGPSSSSGSGTSSLPIGASPSLDLRVPLLSGFLRLQQLRLRKSELIHRRWEH